VKENEHIFTASCALPHPLTAFICCYQRQFLVSLYQQTLPAEMQFVQTAVNKFIPLKPSRRKQATY